jgi:hypothetical protein
MAEAMDGFKLGTQAEGTVFISNISTTVWRAGTANIDTIRKIKEINPYWNKIINNLDQVIFTGQPWIKNLNEDGQTDKITEKLDRRMGKLFFKQKVAIGTKARVSWKDTVQYGGGVFNPIWGKEGSETIPLRLRHLQTDSFADPPYGKSDIYNRILQGIVVGEDGETPEFYQTLKSGTQKKLTNAFLIRNPIGDQLAGPPLLQPLIPLVVMLDFSWQAQMQKVNRIGAPIIFMMINDATDDDIAFGQMFLANWGKNTGMHIRPNMQLIIPDLKDNSSAMETITALTKEAMRFGTPVNMITDSKEGRTLVGGSSNAELRMVYDYVRMQQQWITDEWQPYVQTYLDANDYSGYIAHLMFPAPSLDLSQMYREVVETGFRTQTIGRKDRRDILNKIEGIDLPVLSVDENTGFL